MGNVNALSGSILVLVEYVGLTEVDFSFMLEVDKTLIQHCYRLTAT